VIFHIPIRAPRVTQPDVGVFPLSIPRPLRELLSNDHEAGCNSMWLTSRLPLFLIFHPLFFDALHSVTAFSSLQ
jgi:hypothetical protein